VFESCRKFRGRGPGSSPLSRGDLGILDDLSYGNPISRKGGGPPARPWAPTTAPSSAATIILETAAMPTRRTYPAGSTKTNALPECMAPHIPHNAPRPSPERMRSPRGVEARVRALRWCNPCRRCDRRFMSTPPRGALTATLGVGVGGVEGALSAPCVLAAGAPGYDWPLRAH